jgi:uncharacterized membrane protein YhaH (DUF805 family)
MGSLSIWHLLLISLWVLPAFLPLWIKVPAGPNRFGPKPEALAEHSPMIIGNTIKIALSRISDYKGRSNRAEYWYNYLFCILLWLFSNTLIESSGDDFGLATAIGLILFMLAIALFVPLAVRRLHDLNRSGWWLLIGGGLGSLVIFWWNCQPSQPDQFEQLDEQRSRGAV